MKKKLVMVLLACTALTVTGCGEKEKQTEKPTEAVSTEADVIVEDETTEAATTEAATEEATTEEATTEAATTEAVTTETVTEALTTEAATAEEATTEEATTEEATTEEATTEEATTEEATTEEATTEEATTEEATTEEATTEEATTEEATTEEATTEEATTEEATTEEATTEEATTEEATTEEATTEEATTEEATTEEATTEEATTEEATTEEATTEEATTEEATTEEDTEAESETETETETEFELGEFPEYTASDYVTLGEYKGLKVTEPAVEITDEDVMMQVEWSIPKKEMTEGKVEDGDTVNIDYEGTLDGVAFDGGTAQGADLEIGSGSFIDGFEDGLIGVEIGASTDLNLTFPENYHSEELAGKDVVFHVTVNSLQRPQELTDEVAAEIANGMTADEYKTSVREGMEEQAKAEARSNTEYELMAQVCENAKIDGYPEEALEYTLNRAKMYYMQMASYYGMTLEELIAGSGMEEDAFMAELENVAKEVLTQEMVLRAVAEAEKFEISDDELKEEIETQAAQVGTDADTLLAEYGEEYICNNMLQAKAIEFLYENAVIETGAESESETEEATTEAAAEESETEEATTEAATESETEEATTEAATETQTEEATTEAKTQSESETKAE